MFNYNCIQLNQDFVYVAVKYDVVIILVKSCYYKLKKIINIIPQ